MDNLASLLPRNRPELEAYCGLRASKVRRPCVTVLGHLPLYVAVEDTDLTPYLCDTGLWEPWVTLAMLDLAAPGMRVLNIGANVGYYAALFASVVGPEGSVVAAEPQERLHDCLRATRRANGWGLDRFSMRGAAVGAQAGRVALETDGFALGQTRATRPASLARDTRAGRTAPAVRLPEAMTWNRPTLIFCDAEGAEQGIFTGHEDVLRQRDVTLVLEFSPLRYEDPVAFAAWCHAYAPWPQIIDFDGHVQDIHVQTLVDKGEERMIVLAP